MSKRIIPLTRIEIYWKITRILLTKPGQMATSCDESLIPQNIMAYTYINMREYAYDACLYIHVSLVKFWLLHIPAITVVVVTNQLTCSIYGYNNQTKKTKNQKTKCISFQQEIMQKSFIRNEIEKRHRNEPFWANKYHIFT